MRRPFVAAVMAAVVLGALLAGCARGDEPRTPVRTVEPQNTASSPSPAPPKKDADACRLLTSKERRSIAGVKVDVVAPTAGGVRNARQCRWVKEFTSPAPISIRVATAQAQAWLAGIPGQIDSIIRSGRADGKMIKRLTAARKKILTDAKDLSDKEACGIFSLVVEANGGKKGSKVSVFFQPYTAQSTATAQTCTKGVYTGVTYAEPNLPPSVGLRQAMVRVMGYAHKRAIKLLSE